MLRWESAGLSDAGKVRSVNEDSFLERGDQRIWLVADGMGGHSAGDVASQMIADTFRESELSGTLSELASSAETCLIDINRRLRELSAQRTDQATIGATVVLLLAHGNHILSLWVGDSRLYRLRHGELKQLTQDHSQVEELIKQGLLLREDAENHPASNIVTRAVGATDEIFVDMDYGDAREGDRFLLCSDGLTKELADWEIREILGRGESPGDLCDALIAMALERGARDNVTVVVSKVLG